MSCFIRIADQDVWNPSNAVAKLFIAEAEAISSLLDERTGIGPIIDDECELDAATFPVFVSALLRRHWSTNHPVMRNLLVGVAGVAFVLVSRANVNVQIDDPDCRDYWLAQLPHISRGMVRG
ncbi:hypothetical protein H8N00_08435 [Streptomyces sp. AC563]|uniref:DUF6086 family protein n=1 Tax=Streptomyces buecherae TaxID=2763006 RepID=UPI00164DCCB0|nr:DUF6086 family protein [Streptomyces buecherae]MBC3988908.1 hypothetical protein [Streptomyces buecherae]